MSVQKLLDISTAHVSPEARTWLCESASLNQAATCHGEGNGAALGLVSATLYGWFLSAPELPETGGMDHGMPETLTAVIRYAHSQDCHYILFDADAHIEDTLPIYEEI